MYPRQMSTIKSDKRSIVKEQRLSNRFVNSPCDTKFGYKIPNISASKQHFNWYFETQKFLNFYPYVAWKLIKTVWIYQLKSSSSFFSFHICYGKSEIKFSTLFNYFNYLNQQTHVLKAWISFKCSLHFNIFKNTTRIYWIWKKIEKVYSMV